MFALESPIIARLAALPALAGWQVRSSAAETSRKTVPAVEVRCEGAGASDKGMAALIDVKWGVHLIAARGDGAMAALDVAFAAVVGSLHNWKPGTEGDHPWLPLKLRDVEPVEIAEQGLVAYSLIFQTSAPYYGQQ
jgi:hypothetical protein